MNYIRTWQKKLIKVEAVLLQVILTIFSPLEFTHY